MPQKLNTLGFDHQKIEVTPWITMLIGYLGLKRGGFTGFKPPGLGHLHAEIVIINFW